MSEVKKVDVVSVQTSQTKAQTDPVKKEKETKEKLNAEIQRALSSKSERKETVEETKQEFLKYGKANGEKVTDEKEAQKLAKNYVKNEYNKERSQYTTVFMDKEAYRAAEKERKENYNKLVKQYRQEGLSRREARKKANAQLPENEYLRKGIFGQKKTRAFIEDHKNEFYDEQGNFSSDKFKQKAVEYANTNTAEDEETNYHLSLKERRKVAQEEGTQASVIKNIAKKSNIGYEKDNTNLYRGLVIATATGAGIAAAPLFSSTASSAAAAAAASAASTASSVAGGASAADSAADSSSSASASAAAKAETNGYAIGAGLGFAVGTGIASFIKDKGNTEARVYAPGKETHTSQPDIPPEQPDPSPTQPDPGQVPPPVEPCPITPGEEHEQYCDYQVKKGEYWTGIVAAKYKREDGTGFNLDPKKRTREENKEIMEIVHYLKDKHGIKYSENVQPSTMRLYTEINGKKYNVDCDTAVKEKATKFLPAKKYTGKAADGNSRYFFTDCNGNRSKMYTSKEERDAAMKQALEQQKAA